MLHADIPPPHQTRAIFKRGAGRGRRRQLGPSHPIKLLAGSLIFPISLPPSSSSPRAPLDIGGGYAVKRRLSPPPPPISGVRSPHRTPHRHLPRDERWTRRRRITREPRHSISLLPHPEKVKLGSDLAVVAPWRALRGLRVAGEVNPSHGHPPPRGGNRAHFSPRGAEGKTHPTRLEGGDKL